MAYLAIPGASNSSGDGLLRHYVIKREYAEGSMSVTKLQFPDAALPQAGQPPPMLYKYGTIPHSRLGLVVAELHVAGTQLLAKVVLLLPVVNLNHNS